MAVPSSLTSGFFQILPVLPPQYSAPLDSPQTRQAPVDEISDDAVLPRILRLYLPSPTPRHISAHLHEFSRLCLSPSTHSLAVDADTSLPTLHPLTTFGEANKTSSQLQTSRGWQELKKIQTANGVVGHGYPQPSHPKVSQDNPAWNLRIHQFATMHLWGGTSAVTGCPMAMTDGAAVLLGRELTNHSLPQEVRSILSAARDRLISIDPSFAWTSGQWMTERSGGSDVRGTETLARLLNEDELEADRRADRTIDSLGLPLGPWRVDGFKWFSSATDADMAVLLAKTPKGLSAFYAPMRCRVPSLTIPAQQEVQQDSLGHGYAEIMNGVSISRLKNKLGTKAVPTAELSISGMRAYLLGSEGQGVKIISSLLNITRLHTAHSGVSGWSRGLAISRAFTRARVIKNPAGGKITLATNIQHNRWLAQQTVLYRAYSHLVFFGVALLGQSEHARLTSTPAHRLALLPRDGRDIEQLLRLLTPVMKQACSTASVAGLRECMESLGGVGYCENNEDAGLLNVARLFRDANVNPIWEGTGSVLAEDILRALQVGRGQGGRLLPQVFGTWLDGVVRSIKDDSRVDATTFVAELQAVQGRYATLQKLIGTHSEEQLLWQGRTVSAHFEAIVCAVLLMADAAVDGDEISVAVAKRWVRMKVLPREDDVQQQDSFEREVEMDRRIFLGDHSVAAGAKSQIGSKL